MVSIFDGRGQHTKEALEKNKESVRCWILENPRKPIKSCCDDTGLSYSTVRKHAKAIIEEFNNSKGS